MTFLTGMTIFIAVLLVAIVSLLVVNIRLDKQENIQRQKNHQDLINAVRGN